MNGLRVSLALTNFNRTSMLLESFAQVIDHEIVGEVVVSDDCSNADVIEHLKKYSHPKFRLVTNTQNLGCYANKRRAVSLAVNEWVILFDSDNIMAQDYINRVETLMTAGLSENTIYQPEYARPHFNFGQFAGQNFTRANVAKFSDNDTFTTALNAMNYLVNRDQYLKVWENRSEPWTSDSLLQNYNWLAAGNSIYFVPGLSYEHRVHAGSHYREHVGKNGNLHNELLHKLKQLS